MATSMSTASLYLSYHVFLIHDRLSKKHALGSFQQFIIFSDFGKTIVY